MTKWSQVDSHKYRWEWTRDTQNSRRAPPSAGPRLWSADVTKDRLDCSVASVVIARLWYVVKRVTLVAGTRQMNYVQTVNSIPWLDALSLRAREHDSALSFWLSKRVSFICLFLWQKRSSFFRSAGPVSARCRARLWQEIKCTHRTHSVLWGSEIWSQVATGDVHKCKVGKNMSLGGVYSLRTTVETRAEQAWHIENSVTGQFRNRLYVLLLHKNKMTVYSLRSPISN